MDHDSLPFPRSLGLEETVCSHRLHGGQTPGTHSLGVQGPGGDPARRQVQRVLFSPLCSHRWALRKATFSLQNIKIFSHLLCGILFISLKLRNKYDKNKISVVAQ